MYCIRKIADDLLWVGANDRRLALFEGVYSVPEGVSYNAYLLLDEKTVLFDTVDKAVQERFLENLVHGLNGRTLDYLILQHIEPDHSAAIRGVLNLYPEVTLVLNSKSAEFVNQFYGLDEKTKVLIVKEGDNLATGKHVLNFVMAPMVHWPEVMVTYDSTDRILFSADAFGCFGALNGALFADEVDFNRDYLHRARRYYTNIVGKYGPQVQALLKKASGLTIDIICPLHGFVWRRNLHEILSPHVAWSSYEPEEQGVMIAYASIYGNTENAAEILACRLRELGIKTVMYDVSVTHASEVVAEAFRWSHLVFASTTFNMGIFVNMEALIYDLVAHNIQNRTVAIIGNGSWAPVSGNLIREKLEQCKDMTFVGAATIKSSLKSNQIQEIESLAKAILDTFPSKKTIGITSQAPDGIDSSALQKLPYGLVVLTASENGKDNGCIINTMLQVTHSPLKISITLNKANFTHDMIKNTGRFAVSQLVSHTPFALIERFGFKSGKDTDKFLGESPLRTQNGICYITDYTNAVFAAKVVDSVDCGTHTVFVGELIQSVTLSDEQSLTYQHYLDHIKPSPKKPSKDQEGYICKVCGYVYEGNDLPEDFICPLCKHGAADFERL